MFLKLNTTGMDLFIFHVESLEVGNDKLDEVNIKCLDHVVGVLHCMECKGGQQVGCKNRDGFLTHPHYERQPIDILSLSLSLSVISRYLSWFIYI